MVLFTRLKCLIVITAIFFSPTALDTARAQQNSFSIITVPVSVYALDDETGKLSSPSQQKRLIQVFSKVNKIWAHAGIRFEIKYIGRISLHHNIVREVANGNYKPFLDGRDQEFHLMRPSIINVFYAKEVGLLNGVALENNTIIIKDSPGPQTSRVTAHELGHALGVSHVNDDKLRLMFPGTMGTALTASEIKAARTNALKK